MTTLKSISMLIALSELLETTRDVVYNYKALCEYCLAESNQLNVRSKDDMTHRLFCASIIDDTFELALIERTNVYSSKQIENLLGRITEKIFYYANKGAFNEVSYETRSRIYKDFGWGISYAGFPKV